jgi:hypothetical protein
VNPPTKGNTAAAPLVRGRPPSGPASTAFELQSRVIADRPPPVRFLPSPGLGLAFLLSQSRMLAAVWRPCESLGGGHNSSVSQWVLPVWFKSIRLLSLEASEIDHPSCANRLDRGVVTCLSPYPRSHKGSWRPCSALVNLMSPIKTA